MVYIILALLLYTAVTLLGTAASRHANTNVVSAIEAAVSAVVPLVVVIPMIGKKSVQNQRFGIVMSVLCGIAIGLFTLALVKSFSENKVGVVTPVVFGGAIFLSTILGYFIYKEKVSALHLVGLVFLGIGFGIVIYARAYNK
jgi:drug/metabolite transporter (DMT)-like permease